jgi:hypothetical protein
MKRSSAPEAQAVRDMLDGRHEDLKTGGEECFRAPFS